MIAILYNTATDKCSENTKERYFNSEYIKVVTINEDLYTAQINSYKKLNTIEILKAKKDETLD